MKVVSEFAHDEIQSDARTPASSHSKEGARVGTSVGCCPGRAQFLTGAAPASFASFVRPPGRSVGRYASRL